MRRRSCLPLALAWLTAGCQLAPPSAGELRAPSAPESASSDLTPEQYADSGLPADAPSGPARSVVTWNLQWFLDPTRGPSDDTRQLAGARAVLDALAPELLALQELSSETALDALLDGSPLRAAAITSFEWPQQLAIACSERFAPRAVRVLDALSSAGRAPLEVELEDRASGASVVVIAVHAKAYADTASWEQRRVLAEGLHAHVQAAWPDTAVVVLGDLNDGLTRSNVAGVPSPYASFVSDPRYATPTAALEQQEPDRTLLDHVIVSDELAPQLLPGAAERIDVAALRVGAAISAISDHAPVRVMLTASGP